MHMCAGVRALTLSGRVGLLRTQEWYGGGAEAWTMESMRAALDAERRTQESALTGERTRMDTALRREREDLQARFDQEKSELEAKLERKKEKKGRNQAERGQMVSSKSSVLSTPA